MVDGIYYVQVSNGNFSTQVIKQIIKSKQSIEINLEKIIMLYDIICSIEHDLIEYL